MPAIFLSVCPSLMLPPLPGFFDEIARYHVALIIGGVVCVLLAPFIVLGAKERWVSSQLSLHSNKKWRNLFYLYYLTWILILLIPFLQMPVAFWWSDLHAWRDTANLYVGAASTLHCPFTLDLAAYNSAIPIATALWVAGILLDVVVALLLLYSALKIRKLKKSIIGA